jgi:hypothetical protein
VNWYKLSKSVDTLEYLAYETWNTVFRAVLDTHQHIWISDTVEHQQIFNRVGLNMKTVAATGSIWRDLNKPDDNRLFFTGNAQIVPQYFGHNRNYEAPHNIIVELKNGNFTLLDPMKNDTSKMQFFHEG